MRNLIFLILGILLFSSCETGQQDHDVIKKYGVIKGNAQGTSYSITYAHPDALDLKHGVDSLLMEFDQVLSTYVPESIISKLNGAEDSCVVVSSRHNAHLLAQCNMKAIEIHESSYGAFNPGIYNLIQYWGFFDQEYGDIDSLVIDSLVERLNGVDLGLNVEKLGEDISICKQTDVKFDYNAIAQGYSVDLIAEYLRANGATDAMVELGGEIVCFGENPRGKSWTLGIEKPVENVEKGKSLQTLVYVKNEGLATSGNYRKFYERNGIKYSHTLDPVTGYPVQHSLLSATVLAEDAMTADAWATVFMVMGPEQTKVFLEKEEMDLGVYLMYDTPGGMEVWMNAKMKGRVEESH